MAARWRVRLVTPPRVNDFRSGFFPREFAIRHDAEELKREVESKGGVALVEKINNTGKTNKE